MMKNVLLLLGLAAAASATELTPDNWDSEVAGMSVPGCVWSSSQESFTHKSLYPQMLLRDYFQGSKQASKMAIRSVSISVSVSQTNFVYF